MARWLTIFALLLVASTLGAPSASAQRAEIMTWKIDGETRGALVYAPSAKSADDKPAPLVLAFHGHGDDAENFQHVDLHRSWPEAIVVYLQGSPSPRDGYAGWQVEKGQDGDRDLRLVDAALTSLRSKFSVDNSRIYATGFSNGANFTYFLWAERPDVFAAFAAVAGRLRPSVQPRLPRPFLHIAGTRDEQIPFVDQLGAIETAKRVNGATGIGESCGDGCMLYGAPNGAPVMTWIHSGGHVYPASASARIATFFREHPGKK
jgi:polyhydroxybutyrate depolymerase